MIHQAHINAAVQVLDSATVPQRTVDVRIWNIVCLTSKSISGILNGMFFADKNTKTIIGLA
jgi:hypothetical protein